MVRFILFYFLILSKEIFHLMKATSCTSSMTTKESKKLQRKVSRTKR